MSAHIGTCSTMNKQTRVSLLCFKFLAIGQISKLYVTKGFNDRTSADFIIFGLWSFFVNACVPVSIITLCFCTEEISPFSQWLVVNVTGGSSDTARKSIERKKERNTSGRGFEGINWQLQAKGPHIGAPTHQLHLANGLHSKPLAASVMSDKILRRCPSSCICIECRWRAGTCHFFLAQTLSQS